VRIILHILDGDLRLSCYARNPNLVLFREIFCGNEPHPTAIVNARKTNKLLTNMLGKMLLRSALKTLKADLYPGSAHSQTNVKRAFRLILKALKKAGIIGVGACPELCRRVGDSGFLCGEFCNLIEESGH
jgi:hypothetical protein